MAGISRRAFLGCGAAMGGSTLIASSLRSTFDVVWGAQPASRSEPKRKGSFDGGYGRLQPVTAVNEPNGAAYFALPEGFSYVVFGKTGTPMVSDPSVLNPIHHDGMAAFRGSKDVVRLFRNHEDRNPPGKGSVAGPEDTKYDPLAGAGVTVLDYHPGSRRVVHDFIGINGTHVNCAGGVSYRGSGYLTCEETIDGPEAGYRRKHGYVYYLPIAATKTTHGEPLTAMGRFAHEAAAVDQHTGVVYLTEDAGSGRGSGFYRFLPKNPARLRDGGRLQMLQIHHHPQADLREGQRIRRWLPVSWVDIDVPDPDPVVQAELPNTNSVFGQGYAAGGAMFNRLEGIWPATDSFIFASTSGGDAKNGDVNPDGFAEGYGQIWEYAPGGHGDGARLRLLFESADPTVLDSPDNLTVSPRGQLLVCEDDTSSADKDRHPLAPGIVNVTRLIGVTRTGHTFEFLINRYSTSELAGVCFSPDGTTLFLNVFGNTETGSGFTAAITGPWHRGVL
jgi:uncharacterized protein